MDLVNTIMVFSTLIIPLAFLTTLIPTAISLDTKCEYSIRIPNKRPHETNHYSYYECNTSGVYVEKYCRRGFIFNVAKLVMPSNPRVYKVYK